MSFIDGVNNKDIAVQKWALTTKGDHSVGLDVLVKTILSDCKVPFDCNCPNDKDCLDNNESITAQQLANSIDVLVNIINLLDQRVSFLENT
jgi:hypothetical protein